MRKKISSILLIFISLITFTSCSLREKLLFLNWGEYIDESLISAFEKA